MDERIPERFRGLPYREVNLSWQANVRSFNRAMGQEVNLIPTMPSKASLDLFLGKESLTGYVLDGMIQEELEEIRQAASHNDLPGFIDGGIDLIYVVLGLMNAAGADLSRFWGLVHEANMKKLNGPIREDGKRLKPEGWKPPDIEGMVDMIQWQNNVDVRWQHANALHDHVKSCERCSSEGDGCNEGQDLESFCFSVVGFDPYEAPYA